MVFLANADIDKLRQFIDNVLGDTTNGMLWAEVEKLGGALNDKRIREFKMTVDHCIVDVKE